MASVLIPRQNNNDPNNDDNVDLNDNGRTYWWWSPTAYAIKWAILAALFLLFVAYFVGGYLHAKRRIKKGLPPLGYHRWLLSRRDRARFEPERNQYNFYPVNNGYAMNGYPAPPPAYNPAFAPPPTYQPPEGASKVAPAQGGYPAPPGAPPAGESASGPAR